MRITINTPNGTEQVKVVDWVDGNMFVGTDLFGKTTYFDLDNAKSADEAFSVYSRFVRR